MSAFSIWPDYEAARELLSAAPAEQGAAEWVALRRVGRAMATAAREGRRADGSAVDAAFCDKAEELTVASLLRANLVAAASVVVTKKAHATITHRPFLDRVGAIFSIGVGAAVGVFWLMPESLNNAIMLLSLPGSETSNHFRASLRSDEGALVLPAFTERRAKERVPVAAGVLPGVKAPARMPAFLRGASEDVE